MMCKYCDQGNTEKNYIEVNYCPKFGIKLQEEEINREGVIIRGALEGHVGKFISFDNNKVTLKFDEETLVTVLSDMVWQMR
jgi:hypothetical protein